MQGFRNWVIGEGRDIFGFRREREEKLPTDPQDEPIIGIKADMVVEYMMSRAIRGVSPIMRFSNEIQWGEGTGAVRMKLAPLGAFKVIIRSLQPDLEGVQRWTCRRIVAYQEILHSTKSFDERIASEMMDVIEEVESQQVKAPNPEYDGLEGLTRKIARRASRQDVMPEIFIYKGVQQAKNPNNWMIVFECRGHGVEAPGGNRVEQFSIDMSHNPKTGMIRSIGQLVESPTKGHVWGIQPSEWDECFSSGQAEGEIIKVVTSIFATF